MIIKHSDNQSLNLNHSAMYVYKSKCLLFRPLAGTLLVLFLFLFSSCTDENEQMRSSDRIRFTTRVQNAWVDLGGDRQKAATRSSVSALQAEGTAQLFLHTLYADSIASPFTDDTAPATRAVPRNRDNMYDTFGISAYSYTGAWDGTQLPDFMYDVSVAKRGSAWIPDSNPYWPGSAYKMKFFAYAPKGSDAYRLSDRGAAGAPTISCAIPADVAEQHDLLVAASTEVSGNANTSVDLMFRHALTAVKFVCGSDMKAGTVKSVTLKGVNSAGVYRFETHAWSDIGTVKDFSQTLDKASSGTAGEAITADAQTFMMIPQTLPENAKIEIVFDDGTGRRTLSGNIAGSEWPMGKTVTYKISTSSLNWEYVLTVNPPAGFSYTGGTNNYSVTSYKQNSKGEKVPVKWKAQFSTDGGTTWSDTKPEWLTAFTASGEGDTTAASFNATVNAQTGITDNPHTTALQNAAPKGSSTSAYNLSNQTNGGSTIQNTANCYVVSAPGYYSFPLVYGNAIKNGSTNRSAYHTDVTSTTDGKGEMLTDFINHAGKAITDPYLTNNGCVPAKAELVWQDAPSLVSEIKYNTGSSGGNISFKVDKNTIQQGNAVIAIKDASNTTLWSWHIWVTDEDVNNTIEVTNYQQVKYKLMPVNLGWCEGGTVTYAARDCKVRFTAGERTSDIAVSQKKAEITSGGNNTFYQWGRKDPLRPSNGVSGNKIWYDANNAASAANMKVESFPYGSETIKNYILKPDVMQKETGGDNTYYNLWSADNNTYSANDNPVVKTIYDPCPVGFSLPAPNAFTGFTTTGNRATSPSQVNGSWDSTRKGWNFYTRANKSGQQIFFPLSGMRYVKSPGLFYIGGDGCIWAAVPAYKKVGRYLDCRDSFVNPFGETGQRICGYSVRAVQEPVDLQPSGIEDWGDGETREIDL